MRVFLDANILFSASDSNSPTGRVIRLLLNHAVAVTCDYAYEEARRNVELKWPDKTTGLEFLISKIEIVSTHCFAPPTKLAEKDIPILCSAIRGGCSYLVTSDKRDFGHLYEQAVQGVTIITLLRLAELLIDPQNGS